MVNPILSKKYCDTRITYCVRNCCAGGVCRFSTQVMVTEGERCDCLHKFRKGQTDLNLILSKKNCDTMLAYCVRNCCAVGVCRFCTQVMATGERCDCLHKIRKGQTDLNLILSKKYCDTRIAYCVRNRCAGGVYGFCTQLMATGERCDCLYKFRQGQTDLNLILSKKCDTMIADCVCRQCDEILCTTHGDWREI